MDHALGPHVLNVGRAARDLARNVDALHVGAEDAVVARLAIGHLHPHRDREVERGREVAVAQRPATALHSLVPTVSEAASTPSCRAASSSRRTRTFAAACRIAMPLFDID
nr:hypothetical protein [Rubellimicrobium mesophilum]